MADVKNLDQFILCDVFDAYFYDSDDNLVFYSENLTNSDVKGSAESKEVRNGRGNGLWCTLMYNKKVEVSLKTNLFNMATLALLCGTEVGTGNGTAYSPVQELTVATKQVTLEQEPKNGKIKVYDKTNNTLVDSSKYTVTAKAVEFTDETFNGKTIKVMPYEFDVNGDTVVSEVVISSDKFPSAGKLILKGVEKNDKTKEMAEITIICENAQPSTDFSLSTSSEVAPAETEIKLTVQTQTGNKKLMTVQEKML